MLPFLKDSATLSWNCLKGVPWRITSKKIRMVCHSMKLSSCSNKCFRATRLSETKGLYTEISSLIILFLGTNSIKTDKITYRKDSVLSTLGIAQNRAYPTVLRSITMWALQSICHHKLTKRISIPKKAISGLWE